MAGHHMGARPGRAASRVTYWAACVGNPDSHDTSVWRTKLRKLTLAKRRSIRLGRAAVLAVHVPAEWRSLYPAVARL